MEQIPTFPADIMEPTLDLDVRLARKRGGEGAWIWSPVNLTTLLTKRKPLPIAPYFVVMSADKETAKAVSTWRSGLRLKPIHFSYHHVGGAHNPSNFSREQLRNHLISLARTAAKIDRELDISEHLRFLSRWRDEKPRPSSLRLHSHNVTRPNEMTLIGTGEARAAGDEGHLNVSRQDDYIRGITESTDAVMGAWEQIKDRLAFRLMPPRPDLFLVAPSMYVGVAKRFERVIADPSIKKALRGLDRQRDFTIALSLDDESAMDKVAPLLALRGAEMKLTTAAIGLRAAGTLAATIRLPPAVNRTGGVVGQLGRFLRKHEDPPKIKTARVFKLVQQALEDAIPAEHRAMIGKSRSSIKIIGDAPLEWLSIEGVPLGIRHDVSRINSTPGNVFIEQIRPTNDLFIQPDQFRDYLVLSMFEQGDAVAPYLRVGTHHAIDGKGNHIKGTYAEPKSPEEFRAAINRFKGPMVIVDAHAEHENADGPGGLIIGGKSFDVWSLMGKVKMPPVVVLSACDTHPFDRSHATVANGFLACGAIAVVATVLPIRAPQAARFIMRLINRAVHFGAICNDQGYAVPWTHIVGGVLRMELVTDIIRGLEVAGYFDEQSRSRFMLETNTDLNPLRPDWFDRLRNRVMENGTLDRDAWDRKVPDLIAGSDAIRYVHLGNPESIIVASPEVRKAIDTMSVAQPN